MTANVEHRLSWEMPNSIEVDRYEQLRGRGCWKRFDWDVLNLTWHRVEVTFKNDERMDQYNTLKRWAETKEQPIRNVVLERREVPDPEHGWTKVVR